MYDLEILLKSLENTLVYGMFIYNVLYRGCEIHEIHIHTTKGTIIVNEHECRLDFTEPSLHLKHLLFQQAKGEKNSFSEILTAMFRVEDCIIREGE